MHADRGRFEGDALSDALCDAFCDALRPHHPPSAYRLQIAISSACEKVRQIGVFGISSYAPAAVRRRARCSCGPLCDPSCGPFSDPSGTDHPVPMKPPQIDAFQRPGKIRQRGVLKGSHHARGRSSAVGDLERPHYRCTSEGLGDTFLFWNGSQPTLNALDRPTCANAGPRGAAQPQEQRRRGGWSR
jgi:hypothetical protein